MNRVLRFFKNLAVGQIILLVVGIAFIFIFGSPMTMGNIGFALACQGSAIVTLIAISSISGGLMDSSEAMWLDDMDAFKSYTTAQRTAQELRRPSMLIAIGMVALMLGGYFALTSY